jgi:crotonobetainyl-CoA:carnitine CoA-transferase CaiB-like acyl-CoA transferase
MPVHLPLTGVTVIELGQNLAGPLAAQILGDLGADVVKVEKPDGGDDARGWGPPFVDGSGLSFHAMNRNKRSVVLDLRAATDRATLTRLVTSADVFIENLRPGSTEELGLGAETLLALNPRLVYCSMSAFGHSGPLRSKPGYEILLQAYAGLMSVTGEPGRPPVRMGTSVLDFSTGMWTALAAIAALRERDRTGRGSVVRTSLFESALFWMSAHFARYRAGGGPPERAATGSQRLIGFQAFETRDGPVVVAAGNDRLWAKLARVLGRPDWAEDPRFSTVAARFRHRDVLVPELEKIFATATKEQWMGRLEEAGVPCTPILSLEEVVDEPQTHAVGMIQTAPDLGIELIGLPVSFDGVRAPIRRRAPRLGEHTREIAGE